MRSRGPLAVAVLSIMAITFLVGISSLAFAGNNPDAKVAVHVRAHNAKLGCNVTITGCEDIVASEPGFSVDAFPVFYNLTEYLGVQYGLDWPAWTYSAAFTSCSDLVIGSIDWPGSGAAHTWTACQSSGVAIPSFIWLYADAAGTVCPIEYPDSDPQEISVLDCSEGTDIPCGLFCAGLYGATGDDPCAPCDVTFDPLVIEKYDDAGECVNPSDFMTYTIRYTNPNTSAVNNVALTDTLDADVNFQSATGGGTYDGGSRVVTWSIASLAADTVDSVEVVVEVDATADNEITLFNNVGIVSDETDPVKYRHATTVCEYQFAPLVLTKSDDVETCVFPEDQVIYNLVYENTNLFAVTDVALVDDLPNNVDFVSSTGGTYDGGTHSVAWDLGTVGSFAKDSVQVTVAIKTEAPQGSFVNNTTTITGLETGQTTTNLLTGICACLITGPTEVCPGSTTQFAGPDGMDSWSWSVTGDASIPDGMAGQTVDVLADPTCPGSYELQLDVVDGGVPSTCLYTVAIADTEAPVITECPGAISVECLGEIPDPDIGLITATDNCGDVVITHIGDTSDGGNCPEIRTRAYEVADGCGNADTCYQEITIDDLTKPTITECPGPITVECAGDVPVPDVGLVDGTDNCPGSIIVTYLEDVSDGGSCPEIITRSYEVADACGNADTCYQEITVDDTIAPEITFCPANETVSCGDPINFGTPTANDNCEGALGFTIILDESVPGPSPGDIVHRRWWEFADACGNADTCRQEILEEACEYVPLTLGKVDNYGTNCVEREENIAYTISYENTNTLEVTNVTLSDELPSGVTYVSSNPAGTPSGATVDWDLGTLAAGATGSVELVVSVDAGTTPGITLTNTAMITSDETGSTTASENTDVCAAVYDPLILSKVDDIDDCVEREGNITYTISYLNDNTDGVTGVVLTDNLDANVSFVSATGGGTEAGGVVTWDIGTIAAAGGSSVDLVVQVNAGAPAGGTITNECVIVSNEAGEQSDIETTDICPAAFDPLLLQKTHADLGCVGDGTVWTYTIDYQNPNSDPVTGAVLTDNLPPELDYVSSTGGGVEAGGVVTWDLGTIPAATTASVELVVEVNSGITPGGTILNTCAITSNETGETTADKSTPICDCAIDGPTVVCPNSTTEYSTVGGADAYEWFITGMGTIDGDNTGANVSVIAGPDCGASLTLQVDRYQSFGVTTCYYTVDIGDTEDPVITCPADFTVACGEPFEFGIPTATDNCVDPITPVEIAATITPGPGPGELTHERTWEATDDCGNSVTCTQTIIEEACTPLVIHKSDDVGDRPGGCADPGTEITYTIYVENPGLVEAMIVVVTDDLPAGVDFVYADNGGVYEAGPHRVTWNILSLLGDEGRFLELIVQVPGGTMPGINLVNTASIESRQTAPVSTDLTTAVCGTGVLPLDVDIKPGSCPNPYNTKSRGKLPVAILGTDYLDVYDIDPATVMLEGVPILKYSYEDVATPVVDGEPCECHEEGYDGYMDLVVHFSRPALTEAIGPFVDRETRELTMTATKYDGTALQGSDCVWILHKGNQCQAPPQFAVMPEPDETHILLTTEEAAEITLVIYDVHGRAVARLLDEYKAAGTYDVIWNGKSNGVRVPAGVYFATASNSHGSTTRKFVVVR